MTIKPNEFALEKAAEKFAMENFECDVYHNGDYFDPIGFAEEAFIAGARWALKKVKKPLKDFPTTDEEMREFLATTEPVEVPEKYKTPDFIFDDTN